LEEYVWNQFQGSIYVSIDYVPFAYDMNENKNRKNILIKGKDGYHFLGDLWKAVIDKTATWKTKKFKSIILNDVEFINPFGYGGEIEVCAITGIETANLQTIEKGNENEEEISVSPQVYTQIKIGESLVEHKYLVYSNTSQPKHLSENSKYHFNILSSDNSNWYLYDDTLHKLSSLEDTTVYTIIDEKLDLLLNKKGDKNIYGFRFYGGNKVPDRFDNQNKNRIKTFEELVDENANFKRLAILRMDVDNLSQLFINGFKEINENQIITDNSNFSKLATLSFQLDVFFSGYLNVIHRKYLDKIIIIYSGGDDLFAVGDWQAIIDFAEDIRNEFRNYVCNREDISLSGGIVLIDEKFPISKGAEMAGEAEKQAKNFKNSAGKTKNAINLFGENISWFKEFDGIKKLKDFLYDALNNQKLTKGLLQKIYVFRNMKNNNNLGWRWLSAYTFARHATDKNKDVIEELKKYFITDSINLNNTEYKFGDKERGIDLLAIAARWAELKIRSEK
jgi:CRISPR-associated protein Csm1